MVAAVSISFSVVGIIPEPIQLTATLPIHIEYTVLSQIVLEDIVSPVDINYAVRLVLLVSSIEFSYNVLGLLLGYSSAVVGLSGRSGLALISDTASDDAPVSISDIGFDFPYFGNTYRLVGVSPNLYLTFGFVSSIYTGFSLTNPGVSLQLQASDRSIRAVYAGVVGRGYRIRYEGYTSTSTSSPANVFYEVTLFPDGAIQIVVDYSAFSTVFRKKSMLMRLCPMFCFLLAPPIQSNLVPIYDSF
jgi:hypothetical protein